MMAAETGGAPPARNPNEEDRDDDRAQYQRAEKQREANSNRHPFQH
ncbi:hypothetical protein [Streptomyces lydicus]